MQGPFSTPTKDSRPPLSRAEKAVLLLLALGKPRASHLLKQLQPDDHARLQATATSLRPISARDLEQLVEEFASEIKDNVGFNGTLAEFNALFDDATIDAPMAGPGGKMDGGDEPAASVWERIEQLGDEAVNGILGREHPQVAALILSRLNAAASARLMAGLEAKQRHDLLARMFSVGGLDPSIAKIAEQAIEEDLFSTVTMPGKSESRMHTGLAQILNRLDKALTDDAMRALSAARPLEVDKIRRMLFAFEDLVALSAEARTKLFDQTPMEQVVLALKGADPMLQGAVLSALGARARRMVEAELQSNSPAAERDVANARRGLVETVLKLVSSGAISFDPPAPAGPA